MQNQFSREFVEQKDNERKERESIIPQRVEIQFPDVTDNQSSNDILIPIIISGFIFLLACFVLAVKYIF